MGSIIYASLTFCHDLSRSILKSSLKSRPNTSHSNKHRVNLLLSNSCSRWYGSSCRGDNRCQTNKRNGCANSRDFTMVPSKKIFYGDIKNMRTYLTGPSHPNGGLNISCDTQLSVCWVDKTYLWFTIIILTSLKEFRVFSMPECVLVFSVSLWSREIPLERKGYM